MIGSRAMGPAWLPTVTLGALVAGVAAFLNPLLALALVAMTLGALLLVTPALGLPLLILASAINRYGVQWGDAQIRIEIIVVLLLAVVATNKLAVKTSTPHLLRTPLTWPLLVYVLVNLVSTLLFARERTRGLKLDAEIFTAALTYIVAVSLLTSRGRIERAIRLLWMATLMEAVLGIVTTLAFVAHLSTFGVQIGDLGLPMATGTQWEPNIFGSFLLGNFFLLLADYLQGSRPGWQLLGLGAIIISIGLSETRTVWIALVVGVGIFLFLASRFRSQASTVLPLLVAMPVLALVGLIVGSATPFAQRFLDLVNLKTSSASGRLVEFQAAVTDWTRHPLLGSGTGSFNFGAAPGLPHPWLPNIVLLTLHDTGVLGLLALALLVWRFYGTLFDALREKGDYSLLIVGGIAGFTALLIAFQTTSGFWFAYPWIVVAIAIAAARFSAAPT